MQIRRTWLPIALLVAVVSGHAGALAAWIHLDGDSTSGVCCGLALPVVEGMKERASRQTGEGRSGWNRDQGLIPAYGNAVFHALGRNPDGPLYGVLAAFVLAQVLMFMLGWELKGPWAGLLAAGLMPLFPAIAYLTRRWDVHGPQLAILCAGALFVLRSRGLSRPLWTAGFGGVLVLGALSSSRETDNILLILALAAMASGGALRAWITERDAWGRSVSRTRCSMGAGVIIAVLAGLVALAAGGLPGDAPQQGHAIHPLMRYLEESGREEFRAQLPWWHLRHLTAYGVHLFWYGLTPWLAIPVAVAAGFYLRWGRGRAEVLAWVLVPLVVLSLIPKKNFYYLAVIYPALPLVAALGIASLRRRWFAVGAALAVCAVGLGLWTVRSFPGERGAGAGDAGGSAATWEAGEAVFQTSAAELALDLAPRADCRAEVLATIAPPATPGTHGDCRYGVWLVGFPDEMEIPLRIATWNPSATIQTGERGENDESIGLILSRGFEPQTAGIPGPSLELLGTYRLCGGDVRVFRRPEAWFRHRCDLHLPDLDRSGGS